MKVLVVEDEHQIADFISMVLTNEGIGVTVASSVDQVLANDYLKFVDLVVLDLMLQGNKSGKDLIKEIKKSKLSVPVIVLSALSQISTKIELLNLGADDYMTKPFSSEELLARVRSVYRRYLDMNEQQDVKVADLLYRRQDNMVFRGGKAITLTVKEAEVLLFLIQRVGRVVSNQDLLTKVWAKKAAFSSNILASIIKRLRLKIDDGYEHKLIKNAHGVGYWIDPGEDKKEV